MRHHGMGHKVGRIIGMTILGVFGAAFLGLVLGYLVEYLWNWLMPSVFGVGKISYWQAFGLFILAKLLFGGMGHHGPHHAPKPPYHHGDWPENKCKPQPWVYYDEWWYKEGKASFDTYLESIRKEKEGEGER